MIVSALKKLVVPDTAQRHAHTLYVRIVEQSRKAFFYDTFAVTDTVDGRFDVILLHLYLVITRLQQNYKHENGEAIRALSEVFFADMDRNLREMGTTDTGVGKRVQKMSQAFYGRMQAYTEGMQNPEQLPKSLHRNLYRERDGEFPLAAVAAYMRRNADQLAAQPDSALLQGLIQFVD